MGRAKDGSISFITGKGLYMDEDQGVYLWRSLYITNFDPKKELFSAFWQDEESNKKIFEISRINTLFTAEDPKKFALRVAKAHQERVYADS